MKYQIGTSDLSRSQPSRINGEVTAIQRMMYALLAASVMLIATCDANVTVNSPGLTYQKSSFSAKLASDLSPSSSQNQPIVFGAVLNNVGDNYSASNGKFTASIAGTYVFTVSLMNKNTANSVAFGCLQLNAIEQTCVWANSAGVHQMSTNTAILNLGVGDVVNVVLKAGSNYEVHSAGGAGYCSFSGFLLYPDGGAMKQLATVLTTLTN